jgi:hypothetical protein
MKYIYYKLYKPAMNIRKLKPSKAYDGLWIVVIILIFFFLMVTMLSIKIATIMVYFVFIAFAIYGFYGFSRTHNIYYLFSGLFTLTYSGFLGFVPTIGVFSENKAIAFTCLFIAVGFGIAAFSQVIMRNHKWRGRDLFELIARNVDTEANGFTSRPHPVGNIECTRYELISFVKYLQSKLVGLVLIDDKKIYLVPVKSGHEYSMIFKSGYRLLEGSWISFQDDGQISVQISKADYLDYMEPLSFNQLCKSMGEQYIEFFTQYKNGEEIRIIDKLNSANTGIFS